MNEEVAADRLAEGQLDLPTQEMEHVCRSGRVADEPVGLVQLLHFEVSIQLLRSSHHIA